MPRYIPPSLRREVSEDEKLAQDVKAVQDYSDHDFPLLGGTGQVGKKPVLEYAAKAQEWEQKIIKERVDARMNAFKQERKRQEEEENRLMFAAIPKPKQPVPVVKPLVEEIIEEPKQEDEWTLVKPKVRKPKKEKVYTEEDFELEDIGGEEDESMWP